MTIKIEDRNTTDEEYKRIVAAFDEHSLEHDNPPDKQERFGFVATDDGVFVGCSTGLAQKNNDLYEPYFYLTDLIVEKPYRKFGYGKKLLNLLEEKVKTLGIQYVWTWTAGYEAPSFYLKQGYEVFASFENYYPTGHARVGFIKRI